VEGAAFKDFLAYASAAYATLRRHGSLLICLFSLMISCGLPELRTGREIDWMRRALRFDLDGSGALHWQLTAWSTCSCCTST